jgi:aspartyl-tRNA(Asn)/glutamyl-tRNA(Gln) amidotransferase subunit A
MWTVARMAADLAAGRASSRELVEQALARIADSSGEGARAFVKTYAETARAEAALADRLRAAGIVRSPVDGLPVSVKDLFDVGGDVTRAGSRLLAGAAPAERDAPAVARLRAAGAVIVGRGTERADAFRAALPPVRPWGRPMA